MKCQCDPKINDKCGDSCLNRITNNECDPESCPCGYECKNTKIQKHTVAAVEIFMTERKGLGLKAMELIKANTYILEYVGEVIEECEYTKRVETMYKDDVHHYGLQLGKKKVIDAHRMGNGPSRDSHGWL